jgi:hypothetical protein
VKSTTGLFLMLCGLSALFQQSPNSSQNGNARAASCEVIDGAIKEVGRLKVGMTRREVETHFKPDGGGQFFNTTRYLYEKCEAVKIDVDFGPPKTADKNSPLPGDIVTNISKPYLEYPMKD